jgi:uncharacterized protein
MARRTRRRRTRPRLTPDVSGRGRRVKPGLLEGGTRGCYLARMATLARPLFPDQEALAAFCRANGIRRLSLFGSRLKGTARPDSDVDLLVEFEPEAQVSLFDVAGMEFELSDMLDGLKVDLRTALDLSRYFRDEVVRMAEPVFVA